MRFFRTLAWNWRFCRHHWPVERELTALKAALGFSVYYHPWHVRRAMRQQSRHEPWAWLPPDPWYRRAWTALLVSLRLRKKPEVGFYFARLEFFERQERT